MMSIKDTEQSTKLRVHEMPLYTDPMKYVRRNNNAAPGILETKISEIRESISDYLVPVQNAYRRSVLLVDSGRTYTINSVDYIQSDPAVLARVGVITVATLSGLIAGYRGGRFKKILYGGMFGGTVAALCYPKQTSNAFFICMDKSQEFIELNVAYPRDRTIKIPRTTKVMDLPKVISQPNEVVTVDKSSTDFEDHGQSIPGDKDLYTTRT